MKRISAKGIKSSRMSLVDILGESVSGMMTRPGRAALTSLGTVIGVTVFVATLGLASTAAGQISSRFDAMAATEVTVTDQTSLPDLPLGVIPGFGDDPELAASKINGLSASGIYFTPDITTSEDNSVQGSLWPPGPPNAEKNSVSVDVMAVTPGFFTAVHAELQQGREFDIFHQTREEPVAVLGRATAQRLGLGTVEQQPTVFIENQPFSVIGIVDDVERVPMALTSVLIPDTTANRIWGAPGPGEGQVSLVVDTEIGAAQQVGAEIATAIRPDYPGVLQVQMPPDPRTLRDGINNDMTGLFMALAVVCLFVGAVGIANTTLVSVIERVPEIGLRRALGARKFHIAAQFLIESAGLGFIGGMVGATLGASTVIGVSLAQTWGPLLDPRTIISAPLVGAGIGLLAGAYPSWRAARTEPAQALRS
ncbi:ABC transporter permease [Nocardiopsis sp. JB363]|uniref:ABC transporter permease n=1 Tax=Nocardiopsis sp. JB363 TaxID=1434837 RepID=UPI000B35AE72|nr:ABC transporter permease [Nocardiopsis sp. JB363]